MFASRSTKQVLETALARLVRETPVTVTSPGSVARTWFEIFAEELGYGYRIYDIADTQLTLSTAGGRALERLGDIFGLQRTSNTSVIPSSDGIVYFYLNDDPNHTPGVASEAALDAITIPAGTLISTAAPATDPNPITWRVTADCVIYTGASLAYASVEPVTNELYTVGEGSVRYHNLDDTQYPHVYVYNRADLEASPSVESDTNFRFRIANAVRAMATGNALAIRLAVLGTDGVRDCKVRPLASGIGTVDVTVVLEDPAAAGAGDIFAAAQTAVDNIKAAGDLALVARPIETRVDVTGAVIMNDGSSDARVVAAAAAAVRRYLNSLSVGDPIVYARLINEVMSVSPQIRDCTIIEGGLVVDGNPVARTNVTAREAEQFYPGTISFV